MKRARAKIRIALCVCPELIAQAFELAPSHIREISARVSGCRALVEIDRYVELFADSLAQLFCESDAVVHRRVFERHERNHIGRADPRMSALMHAQIDSLRSDADAFERSLNRMLERNDERDHRAIVGL